MKLLPLLLAPLFLLMACSSEDKTAVLKDAARRISEGRAVLVDVREPGEWADTGVAEPAVLLSKSSFEEGSAALNDFLRQNRDKEILLMCRSGNRSGQVARQLERQGMQTKNLGGFSTWKKSGLPTRRVN